MSANGDPRFYEMRNVFLENMDEALDSGASPAFVHEQGGSALGLAINSGRLGVVESILERLGPDCDINSLITDTDVWMLNRIDSDITKLLKRRGMRTD